MTSEKDYEESEPEQLGWITQIKKMLPDNSDKIRIEMKLNK